MAISSLSTISKRSKIDVERRNSNPDLPDDWPGQLSYPGRRQNYFFLSSNVSNGCRPQFHLEPRSFPPQIASASLYFPRVFILPMVYIPRLMISSSFPSFFRPILSPFLLDRSFFTPAFAKRLCSLVLTIFDYIKKFFILIINIQSLIVFYDRTFTTVIKSEWILL